MLSLSHSQEGSVVSGTLVSAKPLLLGVFKCSHKSRSCNKKDKGFAEPILEGFVFGREVRPMVQCHVLKHDRDFSIFQCV